MSGLGGPSAGGGVSGDLDDDDDVNELRELRVDVSGWLGSEGKVKMVVAGMKVMSRLMLMEFLPD